MSEQVTPPRRAARRYVATPIGRRIAYVERGSGEAALFLYRVPLNGFQVQGRTNRGFATQTEWSRVAGLKKRGETRGRRSSWGVLTPLTVEHSVAGARGSGLEGSLGCSRLAWAVEEHRRSLRAEAPRAGTLQPALQAEAQAGGAALLRAGLRPHGGCPRTVRPAREGPHPHVRPVRANTHGRVLAEEKTRRGYIWTFRTQKLIA